MSYSWRNFKIHRFYGLDLKTNTIDTKDGYSLDLSNVFQDTTGVISKRRGNEVMFSSDETSTTEIDEIGSAVLGGTKYYFKFSGGDFHHATTITGAITTISPTPAISTTNQIWWAVMDDKLFFVDGINILRFFDPAISTTTIIDSIVYDRPTAIPSASSGTGFDYIYTVEHGFSTTSTSAESTASPHQIGGSAVNITVPSAINSGDTIAVNDRIRIYSRSNTTIGTYKNVTPGTGSTSEGVYETDVNGSNYLRITSTAANYIISTNAINDNQPNLYTDLGVVGNKSLKDETLTDIPLTGLTVHYGRFIGWANDTVYNSKVTNPHVWPSDTANFEAFQYTVGEGDGENIQGCISYLESLYVFKKTQIFVFGGIGPDNTGNNAYSFRRLETNGIGLIAPKSLKVVGEERSNILLWLSDQGFYGSDGTSPVRVGEKIETDIFTFSQSNLESAVAIHHKRDGAYLCFLGPSSNRIGYFLDTRKDQGDVTGWFKFRNIPIKNIYWDSDRYIFGTYNGFCGSERIDNLSTDFSDIRINYLSFSDVDTSADTLTFSAAHGMSTGDAVVIRTNGTIPAGLTANTTYYVIRDSNAVIRLAASSADATAGNEIDITSQGSGTHSIVGSKAINSYYTTNWINFKSTSSVKKLAKTQLSFDATAVSISLDVSYAYDWVNSFQDSQTITIASSHSWGSGTWGSFVWGSGANAVPKSVATARRKVRAIRYKFENNTINQDFNLQALEVPFDLIRNRNNFA